ALGVGRDAREVGAVEDRALQRAGLVQPLFRLVARDAVAVRVGVEASAAFLDLHLLPLSGRRCAPDGSRFHAPGRNGMNGKQAGTGESEAASINTSRRCSPWMCARPGSITRTIRMEMAIRHVTGPDGECRCCG